jgi:hypothetical protein
MRITALHSLILATALLLGCAEHSLAQRAGAPNVEVAKQALDRKWQKLKPGGIAERNVLFQEVRAGKAEGGSYPFQVTVVIRDYEPGYPANRYYGNTCVSRIEQGVYTLEPDPFGGWEPQGRMTPFMTETKCQKNPSAGVSSIPLASLSGAPAQAAPAQNGQAAPARPQTAQGGNGGAAIAQGSYECWSSNRANLTLNFTIQGGNRYAGYDGKPGTYSLDAASQRITFKGGSLDGVMPNGFYAIYHAPQGRPTVSYRSAGGGEAAFCQKK